MTLLQVAEKLHVDPKALESLEAEQFEQLGAPVYVQGHLKRYSELVGEDTAQILDLYGALDEARAAGSHAAAQGRAPADPGKLVVPSLVVLIAFALIGVVWWILQGVKEGTIGAPVAPRVVDVTPEPETVDAARRCAATGCYQSQARAFNGETRTGESVPPPRAESRGRANGSCPVRRRKALDDAATPHAARARSMSR